MGCLRRSIRLMAVPVMASLATSSTLPLITSAVAR